MLQFSMFLFMFFVNFVSGVTIPTTKYQYAGCYEDRKDIRIFNIKVTTTYNASLVSLLNPNVCVERCAGLAYPYAGISGQECYCSKDYASDVARTSDSECDPQWLKKFENITYPTRLAVYETGVNAIDPNPARIYLGCYRDEDIEFALLKGIKYDLAKNNSPAVCHTYCVNAGYRYFGLKNGVGCLCGDVRPSKEAALEGGECAALCPGNSVTKCGGDKRINVYATGITDVPSDGRYVGCFKNSEEGKSFVADYGIVLKITNSPRRCLNMCSHFGFKFSGVQGRDGCYCSNQASVESLKEADKNCNYVKCAGDETETCGSRYHIKVYKTTKSDETFVGTAPRYLGCFKDQSENPVMEETILALSNSLTPNLCIEICQQRGYSFSGLKFGKYCHCGYYYPSELSRVAESECSSPCPGNPTDHCGGLDRISAYHTGHSRAGALPGSIYKGCFKDDDKNNRILKGAWYQMNNNSPKACQRVCYRAGYRYFGLSWTTECFCGDEELSEMISVDGTECNKPCSGDSNQMCGGSLRTSIYSTGLTDISIADRYVGCFTQPVATGLVSSVGILSEYSITLSRTNSPKKCLNICDQLEYRFSGVEKGIECRCGDTMAMENLRDISLRACDVKCPGDESETCGKMNKIRIFKTTKADNKIPTIPSIPALLSSVLNPTLPAPVTTTIATTTTATTTTTSAPVEPPKLQMCPNWPYPGKLPETEETRRLSLEELQRLVYLEQLRLIRLKIEKLTKNEENKITDDNLIVGEGAQTLQLGSAAAATNLLQIKNDTGTMSWFEYFSNFNYMMYLELKP